MADNITLNPGSTGDVVRTVDRAGVETQIVAIDLNPAGSESLMAGTMPVSGSVTANAGTNLNTSGLAVETGGNLAAAAASLSVLDDWDESDRAKVNLIVGQAGVEGGSGLVSALTQRVVLATDVALPTGTNNIGDVDVLTMPGTAAEAAALPSVFTVVAGDDGTDTQPIQLAADGDLKVTLANEDPFGSNADAASASGSISAKLRQIATTGIPITSLPASTAGIEVVGDVAHNAPAGGNPILNAGQMETPADSAPGTRADTDGDANTFAVIDGAQYVIQGGPQQWHARLTGSMSDTTVKSAPSAGLSLYVSTIVYSIGAGTASSILLEESTTTAKFGPHYLEAVNGRGLCVNFTPPIKIAAATLLSATNTGSATATLDVYGFTAPG